MSRSYKKHPYSTDGSAGTTKKSKRRANKKVRSTQNIPDGGTYKKVYCSWNIHDYVNRWTWAEAKAAYEAEENSYLIRRYPTLKEFYRFWLKCCRSK